MYAPLSVDDLRLAQSGDQQALERLLAGLRPYLERLAREFAEPACASASTADLVQEASLRVWQKLDQFKGGASAEQTTAMLYDWLSQIVRHLALDKRRERHAQRRDPPGGLLRLEATGASSGAGKEIDPATSGPTPSVNVGSEEQAQLIRNALERIANVTGREIVRLCFFEGLSLRQISDRLQLSYDKVRELYHESLRALERELEGLL